MLPVSYDGGAVLLRHAAHRSSYPVFRYHASSTTATKRWSSIELFHIRSFPVVCSVEDGHVENIGQLARRRRRVHRIGVGKLWEGRERDGPVRLAGVEIRHKLIDQLLFGIGRAIYYVPSVIESIKSTARSATAMAGALVLP